MWLACWEIEPAMLDDPGTTLDAAVGDDVDAFHQQDEWSLLPGDGWRTIAHDDAGPWVLATRHQGHADRWIYLQLYRSDHAWRFGDARGGVPIKADPGARPSDLRLTWPAGQIIDARDSSGPRLTATLTNTGARPWNPDNEGPGLIVGAHLLDPASGEPAQAHPMFIYAYGNTVRGAISPGQSMAVPAHVFTGVHAIESGDYTVVGNLMCVSVPAGRGTVTVVGTD